MKLALPNIFARSAPAAADPGADKRGQIALYVGYVVFFVFCFLFFAYLTFPYERLRDIITDRFAILPPDGKAAPKMVMKIEELSPHWLTGVALEGVGGAQRRGPHSGRRGEGDRERGLPGCGSQPTDR